LILSRLYFFYHATDAAGGSPYRNVDRVRSHPVLWADGLAPSRNRRASEPLAGVTADTPAIADEEPPRQRQPGDPLGGAGSGQEPGEDADADGASADDSGGDTLSSEAGSSSTDDDLSEYGDAGVSHQRRPSLTIDLVKEARTAGMPDLAGMCMPPLARHPWQPCQTLNPKP
jgi:hypothetical protein